MSPIGINPACAVSKPAHATPAPAPGPVSRQARRAAQRDRDKATLAALRVEADALIQVLREIPKGVR